MKITGQNQKEKGKQRDLVHAPVGRARTARQTVMCETPKRRAMFRIEMNSVQYTCRMRASTCGPREAGRPRFLRAGAAASADAGLCRSSFWDGSRCRLIAVRSVFTNGEEMDIRHRHAGIRRNGRVRRRPVSGIGSLPTGLRFHFHLLRRADVGLMAKGWRIDEAGIQYKRM